MECRVARNVTEIGKFWMNKYYRAVHLMKSRYGLVSVNLKAKKKKLLLK